MAETPNDRSVQIRDICSMAPVVPVLTIHDIETARPLAEALVGGGLPVLEITLRTPQALDCIRTIADVPGAVVGAGTVISPDNLRRAIDAGACFAVSPGATDPLLDQAEAESLPFLPGTATATEAMVLLSRGYTVQKFFPAEALGGIALLKGLAAPLPQISFCPTGGISESNATDYLALPNVVCVGGSWVVPPQAVEQANWPLVERLAHAASQIRR